MLLLTLLLSILYPLLWGLFGYIVGIIILSVLGITPSSINADLELWEVTRRLSRGLS